MQISCVQKVKYRLVCREQFYHVSHVELLVKNDCCTKTGSEFLLGGMFAGNQVGAMIYSDITAQLLICSLFN